MAQATGRPTQEGGGVKYAAIRLDDGRTAEVIPLTFNRARLVVGWPHQQEYEDGW